MLKDKEIEALQKEWQLQLALKDKEKEISLKEKEISLKDKELENKDLQSALKDALKDKEIEAMRMQLQLHVGISLVVNSKLDMRGALEYVFSEAWTQHATELGQATMKKDHKAKAAAVWSLILDKTPQLAVCIGKNTRWQRADMANQLATLYGHLSSHVHGHYQNSMTQVDIAAELVNPDQAGAMECICDAYNIPYKRCPARE